MIERTVIGVDFGKAADDAIRWAARCLDGRTDYVLVHVLDMPQPPRFLRGRFPPHDELVETARNGAAARLRELSADLTGTVRHEVRVGRPAEQIAAVARDLEADLIVVGEHGRRRGVWKLLGSTAEQLLHTAPIPVLLARDVCGGALATILAPIDEAPAPGSALQWAAQLGNRFGARIVALHVLDPAITGRVRLVSASRPAKEFEDDLVVDTRQWIESTIAAAGLRHDRTEAVVAVGNPGYEIIAAGERHDADLIVMTSRGGAPARQRALGSVARTVLRSAACSVLVLTSDS